MMQTQLIVSVHVGNRLGDYSKRWKKLGKIACTNEVGLG